MSSETQIGVDGTESVNKRCRPSKEAQPETSSRKKKRPVRSLVAPHEWSSRSQPPSPPLRSPSQLMRIHSHVIALRQSACRAAEEALFRLCPRANQFLCCRYFCSEVQCEHNSGSMEPDHFVRLRTAVLWHDDET